MSSEGVPFPTFVIILLSVTIIIILTVTGNLSVLRFKAKVGRSYTSLLIWNLGLADFLVGIIVLPMGAVYLIGRRWVLGRVLCRLWIYCDVIFCTSSIGTICIISVDRYLSVTHPLRYRVIVTKSRVITAILFVWLYSCSILMVTVRWNRSGVDDNSSMCFVGNEIRLHTHCVIFAFFLPAIVTVTLHWRVYRMVRRRQRALDQGILLVLDRSMKLVANTVGSEQQFTPLRVHFGGGTDGVTDRRKQVLKSHERIARTLGGVTGVFLCCWLPFFTLYLIDSQYRGYISPIVLDTTSWLGYCNSMLNPIIYSFTVEQFRRSTKKTIKRIIMPIWRPLHLCFPKCVAEPKCDSFKSFQRERISRKIDRKRMLLDDLKMSEIAARLKEDGFKENTVYDCLLENKSRSKGRSNVDKNQPVRIHCLTREENV